MVGGAIERGNGVTSSLETLETMGGCKKFDGGKEGGEKASGGAVEKGDEGGRLVVQDSG